MVEAETEHGERLVRCWRHEGALTPAALVARVRWQLEGWLSATRSEAIAGGAEPPVGLILVRLVPDRSLRPTVVSSASGAATPRPRIGPTGPWPGSRDCSATTRW